MEWRIAFYNAVVKIEMDAWPPSIRATFARIAQRMRTLGPNLGMPFTRALGDGLFEIRAKGNEGIGRAFFCTSSDGGIVILHVFIKKTDKTPRHELETAARRMKEVKYGQ